MLTNYHVVEEVHQIEVQVSGGTGYSATLRGYDAYKDLAVLEICCGRFRSLPFKDATTLKPGSEVVAIGYPLGLFGPATVTRGIVSAVRYEPAYKAWVIQTDAPINPGNSGGPLLASSGQVVGVNTFTFDWSDSGRPVHGVGFAISEQTIRGVLQNMKQGSRVGVSTATATSTPTPSPTPMPVIWRTYSNPAYGYSIEIPSYWKIDDNDKTTVTFRAPNDFAGVGIYLLDWKVGSISEWANTIERSQRDFYKAKFEIVDREVSEHSDGTGNAYLLYRGQISDNNCIQFNGEILIVSYLRSYHFQQWACEHSLEEFEDIHSNILETFTID